LDGQQARGLVHRQTAVFTSLDFESPRACLPVEENESLRMDREALRGGPARHEFLVSLHCGPLPYLSARP
jgi:hypothetical protein